MLHLVLVMLIVMTMYTTTPYARVLCHYGLLMIETRDAWAEGDGERVVRCWQLQGQI